MKTIRAAQNLQALGYKPKQTFSIVAKNSDNVAPVIFASIAIGCTVSCLDPTFEKDELKNLLERTQPGLMFCDVACYDRLKESLKELGIAVKLFTFDGTILDSDPVERLFEETYKENQFM